MKPLRDQALKIVITAAKVRRDDLHHMSTNRNKGRKEAALITAATDYLKGEATE